VTLAAGSKLGPYEILGQIGAGGMGEVYRAKDPRLGREVAIKVLPASFSQDADRLRRFEQEAKAAGVLNHPNITAVYDIGTHEDAPYVVQELLEGETLRSILSGGKLSPRKAIDYSMQIAHGLSAAHEKGIVHRDLKPENLFVTKDGRVKILDFGLAKLRDPQLPAGSLLSQQETVPWTSPGVVLGTVGYMSPEQVRGDPVDARADVFSFGAVLYEMLSGQRAFRGETPVQTMNAILSEDPPTLSSVNPALPPVLERIVHRCLEKQPEDRFHSAHDIGIALQTISGSTERVFTPEIRARSTWRQAAPWAATALVVVVAAVAVAVLWPRPPTAVVMRFSITLPAEHRSTPRQATPLALSPDGTRLVFAAERAGRSQLFLRELDQLRAEPLADTEGARNPFFSPDGGWIGFFTEHGTLQKLSVTGGSPVTICDVQSGYYNGASWGLDDTIFFSQTSRSGGLWRVSASGGTPEKLSPGRWPQVLPDGRHVLFSSMVEGSVSDYQPAVLSLETGESRTLDRGRAGVRYVPSGHLVYGESGGLTAVPFDLSALELRGSPRPVLDGVSVYPYGLAHVAVSDNGSLAYLPGAFRSTLEWVDREGRTRPFLDERGDLWRPRISPDGTKVALVGITERDPWNVWIYDVERGTRNRLTDAGSLRAPAWTPDGARVTFMGPDDHTLYWRNADGSGPVEPLRPGVVPATEHLHPGDWSPDGSQLVVTRSEADINHDIWVIPLDGEPWPVVATEQFDGSPVFSPDGRWLAYVSNESGRLEVYVKAFPGPGGRWVVSTNGGVGPAWSPDGRELFFRDQGGRTMMAASFAGEPEVRIGAPRRLFEGDYSPDEPSCRHYDITPDGQRFLMIRAPEQRSINIVVNWFEELKRLAPVD
jgi:Tol biopolymer transport system component